MTSAELRALLEANDAPGCIVLFAGATEAERKKLASVAAARLRAVTAGVPARLVGFLPRMSEDVLKNVAPDPVALRGGLRAAQVAVLATASCGALKKFGERALPSPDDAFAVFSDRRPPWLGEWAEAVLSLGSAGGLTFNLSDHWRLVRRLVREGLCDRPRSSRYVHGMIASLHTFGGRSQVLQQLRDDPGLLDDEIWDIFETEPERGSLSLLSAERSPSPAATWEGALAVLAGEGRISRSRLLDASLAGLERDFHEQRARWLALMHETLLPTLDEQSERLDRYLGLAASRNPSTVSFALKTLTTLEKAGRLEAGSVVASVGPVLLVRAKGTVLSALVLLDRAAGRQPGVRSRAAVVSLDALAHESPAVHEAVLDLIERHGDRNDPALTDELRARADSIAPSQRPRALTWLGTTEGTAEAEPDPQDASLDDLLARARALDSEVARKSGVTAMVDLIGREDGEIEAIDFDDADAPRLVPEQAIVPINDLDELIATFSQVLENASNPDDVERVLDGVSRLCDQVPTDFAARTGPMRVRAARGEQPVSLCRVLNGLALSWATGKPHHIDYADTFAYRYIVGIFARRVHALAHRVADRQAAPLLGAPTHVGGWIDPRVLVERAHTQMRLPSKLDRLDASLALLRLAPDPGPRADALQAAAGLEGHFAAALRYALGGEEKTVGPDARLWVAAARARAPRDDDPLVLVRHPDLGPDAGQAARRAVLPGPHPTRDRFIRAQHHIISCDPPVQKADNPDLLTVLLHDIVAHGAADATGWVASAWPLGRESFFAAGADLMLGVELPPGEAVSYRPFIEALLDPDTPLRPMARLLLAGTLSSNRPELQGLAVDALVAAVDDGRLDGRLLGETLRQVLTEGLAKPARLAKALADAARVSPLHARLAAIALQRLTAGQSPPPLGFHLLLELLKELLVETGQRVDDPVVRATLGGLPSSGKTGRLVRDILALEAMNGTSNRARSRSLVTRQPRRAMGDESCLTCTALASGA
jgi:Family of unknown function (DUF6493)